MKNTRKKLSNIIDWILAFSLSLVIVNIFVIPYFHFSAWIDIPTNATNAIFNPGSIIIEGDEGYGIHFVDKNGYVNPETRTNYNSYILIMGASHSVGKEIPIGYSYADLLEKEYGFQVYNMAMDGHYYPQIINGFESAMKEFPNASSIVIEIGSTDFDTNELEDSLTQRIYNECYLGENIINSLSIKQKIKVLYQEAFPLLRIINKNFTVAHQKKGLVNETSHTVDNQYDINEESAYAGILDASMQLIRKYYSGTVIIVYHPTVQLKQDGTLKAISLSTDELFKQKCAKYEINFIDMGLLFEKEYIENKSIPYGFMNTALGSGHLNKTGHKLIASELAKILGEEK